MDKILHQVRLVVYPIIYRVLYILGGAGFLPSTVFPRELFFGLVWWDWRDWRDFCSALLTCNCRVMGCDVLVVRWKYHLNVYDLSLYVVYVYRAFGRAARLRHGDGVTILMKLPQNSQFYHWLPHNLRVLYLHVFTHTNGANMMNCTLISTVLCVEVFWNARALAHM